MDDIIKIANTNVVYFISIYLLIINLVSFIMVKLDKYLAINHKFRISEKALFTLSLLGGSLGTFIGMFAFRHKTKRNNFLIGIPVLFNVNVITVFIILKITNII